MARIYLIPSTNSTSVSWTNTAIWEGGVAPGNGDEAYLRNAAVKFDLTLSHSGIKLAKLVVADTFTGALGGTGTNVLQISFDVGLFHVKGVAGQSSTGSPLININHGTNAADITVYGTKAPPGTDAGQMPCRFVGNAASGTQLTVASGYVGYGVNNISETGACHTLNVIGANAHVVMGPGVTLGTINQSAGELEVNTAVATLNLSGGSVTTEGNWQLGTANLTGGRAVMNHRNSGGTEVTALQMYGASATLDLGQKVDAFAATATAYRAGSIQQFSPTQFSPGTLTLDFNGNKSITVSPSK